VRTGTDLFHVKQALPQTDFST